MTDNMTDSAWFKANPTRHYRIRRHGEADHQNLTAVAIVKIAVDRRAWSTRNIKMRDGLPDTDEAAALALQEYEFIVTAQLVRLHGRHTSVQAVLDNLRRDAAEGGMH